MNKYNPEEIVELIVFFLSLGTTIFLAVLFIGLVDSFNYIQIIASLVGLTLSSICTYCLYKINKENIDSMFED